jgi:hypothetical protein
VAAEAGTAANATNPIACESVIQAPGASARGLFAFGDRRLLRTRATWGVAPGYDYAAPLGRKPKPWKGVIIIAWGDAPGSLAKFIGENRAPFGHRKEAGWTIPESRLD